MNDDEPQYLYIQDVIEILTNIKLKQGNLPVFINHGFSNYFLTQNDVYGIHYVKDPPCVALSVET